MSRISQEKMGIVIVLSCGMVWGLGGVMGQILFTQENMTAGWLSTIRMLISGCCILGYLIKKEGKKCFRIFSNWKDACSCIAFAIVGVMAMQFTYFKAIQSSNAATATVLQYTYPILILIVTAFQQKKFPKYYEIFAIISAFIGIVLVATHGKLTSLQISRQALAWGIAAAVSFVIYTVAPKKLYEKFGILEIMGWSMLFGGGILFFLTNCSKTGLEINTKSVSLTLLITFMSTLYPMIAYGKGVFILGNIKASLFVTIEPVFCAVVSAILGIAKFQLVDLAGFLFILVPIEFVAVKSAKENKAKK